MNDFRLAMIGNNSAFEQTWSTYTRVGEYYISIKTGYFYRSVPKKFTVNIVDYTHMEIAIFDNHHNWVQPREDEYISNYNNINMLLECYEEGEIAVGNYVPIELIQDLVNYLEKSTDM